MKKGGGGEFILSAPLFVVLKDEPFIINAEGMVAPARNVMENVFFWIYLFSGAFEHRIVVIFLTFFWPKKFENMRRNLLCD